MPLSAPSSRQPPHLREERPILDIPGILRVAKNFRECSLNAVRNRRLWRPLSRAPAVVLLGSRQVGKMTLARNILDGMSPSAIYLDLERQADTQRLDDPDAYLRLRSDTLVAIAEVQRRPALFPELRAIIDANRRASKRSNQFLLLGSASLQLLRQWSESLAGRVAWHRLG